MARHALAASLRARRLHRHGSEIPDAVPTGGARAQVRAGEPVQFTAELETPDGAGAIVSAEWDFDATEQVGDPNFAQRPLVEQMHPNNEVGRFTIAEQFTPASRVQFTRTHTFARPGTYFPALRANAQRQGDAATPYARIPNLGRVRVVVT